MKTQFIAKEHDSLLIIPIINEGSRIINQLKAIEKISNRNFDILLVDGNSKDGSIENIIAGYSKLVNTLIIVTNSRGLSHQLRVAFRYGLDHRYKYFVTMDGNNKDDAQGVQSILNKLMQGFDFVQGSRFIRTNSSFNTPLHRIFAIKFIHAPIVSFASGNKYTDTTNGFRGFSSNLLDSKEIGIFRDIFCQYELIPYIPIKVGKLKLKSCEVPVIRRYPTKTKTPTKINGINAHLRILKSLFLSAIGFYDPK
jgi:dolichol-phosphate mannosyltransferase